MLLRAAVGIAALVQGAFYLGDPASPGPEKWVAGVLALAAGSSLLLGFLTPIAGILVGLAAVGIGFSVLPAPNPNLFDTQLPTVFTAIMTAAITFLGPGAFSLDARLFGRREIIIPPISRSSRS